MSSGLDERFIPLNLPNPYFVDKNTGEALANGKMVFTRDTARTTPKPVYQLVNSGGTYTYVPLPNPVTLSGVGTIQDDAENNVALYLFPYITDPATKRLTLDLYYLEVFDSASYPLGPSQFTREAIPNLNDVNDPIDEPSNDVSNQLANPQFSRYFLQDSVETLTVSGALTEFPIAPDWDLVANGTGTINIERIPVEGNEAIPTYPSYYLQITTNLGITNAFLRQRFKFNSGIWSGKFISGFFAARLVSGTSGVTMKYEDSSGVNSNVTVFSASINNEWNSYGGSVQLTSSSNTQSGEDAYVDITISLPPGSVIDITSFQILVSDADFLDTQGYTARTTNREQALMGDYFIPALEYKPIPSLLIGWDFPLNPRKFGDSGSVTSTIEYILDQTILQTMPGLTVNFSKNPLTGGLSLNHQQADLSYAVIQYLDGDQASKFLGTSLSVNVSGYTQDGGNSADTTSIQVRIFANASDVQFGTLPVSLFTLSSDGTVTLTGLAVTNGWYEISRNNLPVAKGNLEPLIPTSQLSEDKDLKFNKWEINDETQVSNGVKGIAVVISFSPAASSTDYETQIDSISVVPGDIPTRPAPLSLGEVLYQCEFYYETTYHPSLIAGTITYDNTYSVHQFTINLGGSNYQVDANPFVIFLNSIKRKSPNMTFYSPSAGTINSADLVLSIPGVFPRSTQVLGFPPAKYSLVASSRQNLTYDADGSILSTFNIPPHLGSAVAHLAMHYVADARIAVV